MPAVSPTRRAHVTPTYFTEAEYERVRTVATSHDRTVSDYMRMLVLDDVRRHENAESTSAAIGSSR